MSADIVIWPLEDDNSYNVLWDAWYLDPATKKFTKLSDEDNRYGFLNLPDIFMLIEKDWMEYPFWSLENGFRMDGTRGPYIQGRIG